MTQPLVPGLSDDSAKRLFIEWLDTQQGKLPVLARRPLLRDWCRMAFFAGYTRGYLNRARAVIPSWGRRPASAAAAPAGDHALRDAALLALYTLEGWANHDEWLWPVSALEQAKRNTTEAVAALETALSHPATPPTPAAGEVGELVEHLRAELRGFHPRHRALGELTIARLTRIADLLEQFSAQAPQPVAVSERLPRAEDCDEQGRCWLFGKVEGDWRLLDPRNSGVPNLKYCFSHWLPAHALPIPQQEES